MALTIIKPSGGGLGLSSPGTAGNVLVSTGTAWASQEPAATGPKITNIQITNSSYTVLDDTAVSTSGGYIKITGSGFLAGAQVIIGTTNATSIGVVSSTVLNVQVPALTAGTYTVYVVNTDGSVGIRVNGLTYSGTPTWVTGSTLPSAQINAAISIQLSATGDAPLTYALQAGSTLPAGLTLTSGGLLSGTITGITVETTYNFTIEAIDNEAQESPRAFSITISATDPNFAYVSLLLSANTPTSSTFVKDASTNNFNVTVYGDTRPNNFGPYTPGYYSNYFDGTSDSLTYTGGSSLNFDTSDFTIETWAYLTNTGTFTPFLRPDDTGTFPEWGYDFSSSVLKFDARNGAIVSTSTTMPVGQWVHLAVSRSGTSLRQFVNGTQVGSTTTNSTNFGSTTGTIRIGGSSFSGSHNVNGYLSNFRIVKGTAVYTSNFTPSTTPLTAIANTSLLTCQSNRFIDNSTNNFTITRNGDTTINGFDPFVPSNSYATYGSGYFDGTGDYLSIPNNTAFTLMASDFTIEAWFYLTATPGGTYGSAIIAKSNGNNGWSLRVYSNNCAWVYPGAAQYNWGPAISNNIWYHIAIVRSSGTVTGFLNGTQYSITNTTANEVAEPITIGNDNGNFSPLTGYISNVRVVKGTAVYTGNFTPSTTPLTAITNTSLLTLQTNQPTNNNMFVDNSTNNFNITRNGNTTQGTFSPYAGTWSNYFDGTGDYLTIPNSSTLLFGSGNFTVETWVYPTVFAADRWIVGFWSYTVPANQSWALYMNNTTGGYVFIIQGDAGAEDFQILTTSNTVVINQWTHVAVTRSGSSWRMFINGVQSATATYNGTLASPSTVLMVAGVESVPQLYIGYISNLRVVKGTAVYTSAFTPPTQPLIAISGTGLLTCADNRLIDDSPNNFTISRFGDVSVQKFSPFTIQTQIVPTSYSVAFDGTGDYLSCGTNSAFAMGTGDFTWEAWVYFASGASFRQIFSTRSTSGSSSAQGSLSVSNTNGLNWYTNSAIINYTTSIGTDQWVHVAICRSSTTIRAFANGVIVGSATNSDNLTGSTFSVGANNDGSETFNGLISNVRVVKGTALYTANFTPSTTPLTAVAGTSLLTCQNTTIIDNSTNNFTITVNGNSQPLPQNPFGYTNPSFSSYTISALGGSMYFDGTGDYLNTTGSNLVIGTGSFTMECWVYPTVFGSFDGYMSSAGDGTGIGVSMSVDQCWIGNNSQAITYNWSAAIRLNQWNHLAIARDGSTVRWLVNGSLLNTGTNSTNITSSTIAIGRRYYDYNGYYATGYISSPRIVKGQALYTSAFIPPPAPLTAVQNSVLLLNGTGGGIIDSSMVTELETVADTRINNTIVKFSGTNSIYFDGTGDYLLLKPSVALEFGSASFTIEFWWYPTATSRQALYHGSFGTDWSIGIDYSSISTNQKIGIWASSNGTSWNLINADSGGNGIGTTTVTQNAWNHIAYVRNGTTWMLFVNGNRDLNLTGISGSIVSRPTTQKVIAAWFSTGSVPQATGYMSDFRITNGIARYTANFTPPTSPFITY